MEQYTELELLEKQYNDLLEEKHRLLNINDEPKSKNNFEQKYNELLSKYESQVEKYEKLCDKYNDLADKYISVKYPEIEELKIKE